MTRMERRRRRRRILRIKLATTAAVLALTTASIVALTGGAAETAPEPTPQPPVLQAEPVLLVAEHDSTYQPVQMTAEPAQEPEPVEEEDENEKIEAALLEQGYRYYVDVPVTEAAETQFPNVALHKAALETAKNAGLCPTVQTLAGALRFWAKRSPDEDMEATIALVSPGASSSGGGGGSTYVLPVATATRLGGVKIGKGISVAADGTITASTSGVSPDDMASTEDTESMLDEVFPSEDENS